MKNQDTQETAGGGSPLPDPLGSMPIAEIGHVTEVFLESLFRAARSLGPETVIRGDIVISTKLGTLPLNNVTVSSHEGNRDGKV